MTQLDRYGALLLGLLVTWSALWPGTAAAARSEAQWQFDVFLDEARIGTHRLSVASKGDALHVEIDAEFDIKILFFNAFSYRHRNQEVWRGDCLQRLESSTRENGERTEVAGSVVGERFVVRTGQGASELPRCAMSFAYWNPRMLQAQRLLNPQTGEFEPVTITAAGTSSVELQGRTVAADAYHLEVAGRTIKLWYASADGRWLALESPVRGGRLLRYLPADVPDAASLARIVGPVTGESHAL